jgi:glycosyltransferase involved in cell wall biosynthesis
MVIPVYNEADFLPWTLASIIAQTTAFDLIIVDNGSTDGCIDKARMQLADYS